MMNMNNYEPKKRGKKQSISDESSKPKLIS